MDNTEELIKKLNEEVESLKIEVQRLHALSGDSYNNVPVNCKNCSNHPSNGGNGICHCILGSQVIY